MTNASFELVEFKADAERRGLFAALVSVFGNVDRNGDRVLRGAFKDTLERWKARGKPIPVIFSHDHNDPASYIGSINPEDVKETEKGLVVAGKLDVETNPKAAKVWELLKDGRIDQWSFSYQAVRERIAKDLARELLAVDLFEVGPTLVGANGDTRTLAVKSIQVPEVAQQLEAFEAQVDDLVEAKIGRVLSSKTEERVRDAISKLEDVLSQLGIEEHDAPQEETPETEDQSEEPAEDTTSPVDERLQAAEAFLVERGRLQLTAAEAFLSERSG